MVKPLTLAVDDPTAFEPPVYAELHCLSNFSFQRGASHPEELVERAHALGYAALAITDECTVAGVVRAHAQGRKQGLKLLLGAEFAVPACGETPGFKLVVLAHNLSGWGNLCEFITTARRSADKGRYQVSWLGSDWASLQDCEVLLGLPWGAAVSSGVKSPHDALRFEAACSIVCVVKAIFGPQLWLLTEWLHGLDDALWLYALQRLSKHTAVPLVAAGNVHMHVRSRKPLQDVVTAVRLGQPVSQCGLDQLANGEAHLRSRARLASLYPAELLANTLVVASRCTFNLSELRYHYPVETVMDGMTAVQTLCRYTFEGAARRYPLGTPPDVQQQLEFELALIAELKYEMYFLTVHDIVEFARNRHILCQGRGSAANSAVCFCLHITEVDPARSKLLFARFISRERSELPDIDVDFEHERREEIIQYMYQKYGRDRAALAATVVSYRSKSALRDAGAALGLESAVVDHIAKDHHWFDQNMQKQEVLATRLDKAGLAPQNPAGWALLGQWLQVARQLVGFPRHLSQHVGGFVLTQGKLTRLVPVENAAMVDRSVVQWDKDDLDAVGLLKVDVLALGMLSAIRRCLDLVNQRRVLPLRMQDIPEGDSATYDMVCAADTVGVFQIESRAQMSMLPRLRPRVFYDLVVEVAIVRPGPIQGKMVHPYLHARERQRRGEPLKLVKPELYVALGRTLGVPIFQEQVMQIAMVAAEFTPDEADDLRRSMAAWKRKGGVHRFHERLVSRMVRRGYEAEFAENIFQQILGFGEYGFPESHAASFALLAYVSAWLKCHEPACFLAALLNSQPMGFYGPAQLVYDAKRHGVLVLPVDVTLSTWDCALEETGAPAPAVRLGLRLVQGLSQWAAEEVVKARTKTPFSSTEDLALRAGLDAKTLRALAAADALMALSGHRRQQVWDAAAHKLSSPTVSGLLHGVAVHEASLSLHPAPEPQEVVFDYAATGLTLRQHPLALLRKHLAQLRMMTSAQLQNLPSGRLVSACGIVTARQRPQTAKGTVFVTLEDETGCVNVIVWKSVREKQREEVLHARLLGVYGEWQRDTESGGQVRHLIAHKLEDLTLLLGRLGTESRDFR